MDLVVTDNCLYIYKYICITHNYTYKLTILEYNKTNYNHAPIIIFLIIKKKLVYWKREKNDY